MRCTALPLTVLLLLATGAAAEPIGGHATVIDGDTLEIHGLKVTLYGIDAPEAAQFCGDASEHEYPCGRSAARALSAKIAGAVVTCETRGEAHAKAATALCRVGETDLSAWMVRHGHALANRTATGAYLPQETRAWGGRIGLWAGVFEAPWEWRQRHQPRAGSRTAQADATPAEEAEDAAR